MIRPKQNIFNVTSEPTQPLFATLTSLILHVSLVAWKIFFHFHNLLIYFSIYIVTSKGFSQFCNSHAYSIPLACAGSVLYAIPSLLDVYTIDAHSIHFQFCSLIAFPSLLEQCYILMQYLFVIYSSNLVLFLVSFNAWHQLKCSKVENVWGDLFLLVFVWLVTLKTFFCISPNSAVSQCFFFIRSILFNSS